MEEILASIRRIIADDEAKPPAAEKPASPPAAPKPEKQPAPAAKAPVKDVPPAAPKAAPPPKPAPPPAPPPPAPVSNSQDDIDALLNGLDEATTPEEIRSAPEPEVFELTDDMAVAPAQPPINKMEPADDLDFAEMAAAKPPQRQPAFEPRPVDVPPSGPILSRSTVSTVESAFNALANTVLSNNARTLEDLVKEMLRPMLKAWLDDNLPGLVERIVKAEIERVSRGR
jgi:cell pole-organizing protein PopZ